jgi:hypothetical protein
MNSCPLAPCRPTTGTTQLPGQCSLGGAGGPCLCRAGVQAAQQLVVVVLLLGIEEASHQAAA